MTETIYICNDYQQAIIHIYIIIYIYNYIIIILYTYRIY